MNLTHTNIHQLTLKKRCLENPNRPKSQQNQGIIAVVYSYLLEIGENPVKPNKTLRLEKINRDKWR